ncbi:hypothetical protein N7494_011878 [Penicillium frequentans]|uniref:Mid2 domain-containing protein n=1 Tax=Penicillium frequentans TaxID=3151616 RepID=A0AAD6GA16_9EURO|nr:hypothetical protein N7494_011878 [Penicillium glabrum]
MVTSTTSTASATTTASTDTITTVPMTGIFTPPASCSSSWTYEPEGANDVVGGLLMQNCASADGDDASCWPSGFDNWGRVSASQVFSPGHCPVGYTSAGLSIAQSVTGAVCCLSDFDYTVVGSYPGCISTLASTSSMLVPIRQETGDSTEITGTVTMWGQPISILWEKKDLSLFVSATTTSASSTDSTTASGTTATSLSAASASKASATATAGSDSSSGGSSGGLSTGAGIGIGVGVGVAGVAGLVALALWLFMRKKRNQKSLSEAPGAPNVFYNPQDPNALYTPPVNAHVPPSQPYRPTELDGYATREKHFHELDTS